MDPQTGLSRALLLLLFLYLLPLEGGSHPLGGPSPDLTSKLSGAQDHLRRMAREPQREQMALQPLQQRPTFTRTEEASQAASAAGRGSQYKVPQSFQEPQNPMKMKEAGQAAYASGFGSQNRVPQSFQEPQNPMKVKAPDSDCFGGTKMKMGHQNGMGCSGVKKQ